VVESVLKRDFTTVQGTVLVITLVVVLVNVVVDLLYAIIDPRISVSSQE
jgi:peptide/nickel transport system permease protein